jgi:hypothetical protein
MSITIADAAVAIGADFSDGKFKAELDKSVTKELETAGKTGGAALAKEIETQGAAGGQKLGAKLKESLSAKNILSGLAMGAGMAVFNEIQQGVGSVVSGMIGGAAQMERYNAQLTTLLGDAGAAKTRLAELAQFGASTPFELPEVIEASRTLQVFTKGVLATGDGLRLVGDVAAGTGTPINETAIWFGRLYDAMQSGRPFGEATNRLQEMGAISGASRAKIEALAGGVKDGSITMKDAWSAVSGEFSQFSGLMEVQSSTLEGKWSNLQDAINMGLANIGTQGMPLFKGAIDIAIPVVSIFAGLLVLLAQNGDIVLPVIGALAAVWLGSMVPALLAGLPAWIATAAAVVATTWPFLAIAAVVAAFAYAYKNNLGPIRQITNTIFGAIIGYAKGLIGTFLTLAGTLVGVAAAIPGPWQQAASDMQATIDGMRKSVDEWSVSLPEDLANDKPAVEKAAADTFATIPDEMASAATETKQTLKSTLGDLVDSITKSKSDFKSAWSGALDEGVRSAKIGFEEQQNLADQATITALMANKSKWSKLSAADQAAQREKLLDLQASYTKLLAEDANYGTDAEREAKLTTLLQSKALKDGLSSKDPNIRTMWEGVAETTETQLLALKLNVGELAKESGKTFGEMLADPSIAPYIEAGTSNILELIKLYLSGAISWTEFIDWSAPAPKGSQRYYEEGGGGRQSSPPPATGGGNAGGSDGTGHGVTPYGVSFALGTPYVRETGPYILHRTEAVLNPAEAAIARAGGAPYGSGGNEGSNRGGSGIRDVIFNNVPIRDENAAARTLRRTLSLGIG